ncbi:MAG TPA: PilZ domain-containing protein [Pseudobdellovibrionaceae bacterium]
MAKVINITSRVKSQNSLMNNNKSFEAPVLDMTEAREEILNKERREVKRTILTEFIGTYAVLPERGLMKVTLYDISENGIAFDLEPQEGMFRDGEEVAIRLYLNHTTYFPFNVNVIKSRPMEEEGVIRHGAQFIKGTVNDVALHHFVKFIENVSAGLRKDEGDILVSNIS